jgi:hypothetical protein
MTQLVRRIKMNKADQRDFDSHYEYWDKIKGIPTGCREGGEMSGKIFKDYSSGYQLTHRGFLSLVRELIHFNKRAKWKTCFVIELPLKWFK